jgi:flagellar hook assembly protein FlgD
VAGSPIHPVLGKNHPNPLTSTTTFSISSPGPLVRARVEIWDAGGRAIRSIPVDVIPAGVATLTWDGLDSRGRIVASGTYLYRLVHDRGSTRATKLTVLR